MQRGIPLLVLRAVLRAFLFSRACSKSPSAVDAPTVHTPSTHQSVRQTVRSLPPRLASHGVVRCVLPLRLYSLPIVKTSARARHPNE